MSRWDGSRTAAYTLAPRCRSSTAKARPRPRFAPVTRAVQVSSSMVSLSRQASARIGRVGSARTGRFKQRGRCYSREPTPSGSARRSTCTGNVISRRSVRPPPSTDMRVSRRAGCDRGQPSGWWRAAVGARGCTDFTECSTRTSRQSNVTTRTAFASATGTPGVGRGAQRLSETGELGNGRGHTVDPYRRRSGDGRDDHGVHPAFRVVGHAADEPITGVGRRYPAPEVHRLADVVVVSADLVAVPAQHTQLVLDDLDGIGAQQIACVAVLCNQSQRLVLT